jgi:hypothetical protein
MLACLASPFVHFLGSSIIVRRAFGEKMNQKPYIRIFNIVMLDLLC